MESYERKVNGFKIALIGFFLIMLFVPLIYTFFFYRKALWLSGDSSVLWRDFPKKYEQNFDQNFGFRKNLISYYYLYKIKLLGDSPRMKVGPSNLPTTPGLAAAPIGINKGDGKESMKLDKKDVAVNGNKDAPTIKNSPADTILKVGVMNEKVIVGKNGWLFYAPPDDGFGIDDYQGKIVLSKEELEKINRNFVIQKNWLAKRNIPYIVMVCPNKQSVYHEYLPSVFKKGRTIKEQLEVSDTSQAIFYLHEVFMQDKNKFQYPLYYKTDTHWNDAGAYIAYRELMEKVGTIFQGVQPVPITEYKITISEKEGGDITEMIGLQKFYKDVKVKFEKRPRALPVKKVPSAFIICDSYLIAMEPFLHESFDTLHLSSWIYGFNYKEIERLKPDIVIWQSVERYQKNFLMDVPKEMHE